MARLEAHWGQARFGEVRIDAPYEIVLGQAIAIEADVFLGGVQPEDVLVDARGGLVDGARRIIDGESARFERAGDGGAPGWHRYRGTWVPRAAGHSGCMLRILPRLPRGAPARELPLRFWE